MTDGQKDGQMRLQYPHAFLQSCFNIDCILCKNIMPIKLIFLKSKSGNMIEKV